jgi:hypothetical protein
VTGEDQERQWRRGRPLTEDDDVGLWEGRLSALGGLGMVVYFGCLFISDSDLGHSPAWLIWPALILMVVGVFGSILLRFGRR